MKQLLALLAGTALVFGAQSVLTQPKPPADKAPKADEKRPATGAARPGFENAHAMCIGCHGISGYKTAFPSVYHVPKIAGQQPAYIVAALKAYKSGERSHPSMRGIAASLSEQDINDIANFYASQAVKAPDRVKPPQGRAAELMTKGNCVSCHGANLSKPIDPSYPKLAGQHADYTFVALKSYKAQNNAAVGRNNAVMGAIAKQFSNADLKALSQYIGSLDGEMTVQPEPKFR